MYKGLPEEIKDRQGERLRHYKNNQPLDTECLQIDDIDALLSETAELTAEKERMVAAGQTLYDSLQAIWVDTPETELSLDLGRRVMIAREVWTTALSLKDENQAQGSAKDGEVK